MKHGTHQLDKNTERSTKETKKIQLERVINTKCQRFEIVVINDSTVIGSNTEI